MTLIAAAIIPLALAITIFVLERSGQSLNLMSVGGLAVAVGLIIDDAIVVIEAIARGIAANPERPRSDVIGTVVGRIAGAMTASTLTTVVVFVPLGLLAGVTGFFFRALAFTLASALIVSLVLAVGVAPIVANALLRTARPHAVRADRLHVSYEAILRWALGHRGAVFVGAGVVLGATVLLLVQLPSDFLPKLDEGEFEIKYMLPAGATLADSDTAAGAMEHAVLADADVVSVGRLTGIDTNGFSPTQSNTGTLRVTLRSGARAGYDSIAQRLRDSLGAVVPAASLDFHQLLEDQINDLSGAPQPIEVTLTGPDQATLIALADRTTDAIAKIPGIVDPFDGVIDDGPSLRIAPQGARLGALGVNASELGDALRARTQGIVAAQLPGESSTIPVNVRVAGMPNAAQIDGTSLFFTNGVWALGAAARSAAPPRASDISEENGRLVDRVTANIEGVSLSAIVTNLETTLGQVPLPPGYRFAIGGAHETQQTSFRQFANVIAIAVVLVFGVMLATFGSFRLPLVILCAIPLALIGVAAALFMTRTPFNVSSFMGLLLLVGIVVKNGILLIDVATRRRAAGDDVKTALLKAGATRVRPIVMTTLAAIGGLLPLAFGLGSGAEMERPLAIAVIGGLSTATAFTLVLIPVLYATFLNDTAPNLPARAALAFVFACVVFTAHPATAQQTPAAADTLRFAQFDLATAQQLAIVASPDVRLARATLDAARAGLAQARGTNGFSLVGGYVEAPQGAPGATLAQRLTTYGGQLTLGDVAALAPLAAQAAAGVREAQTDALAAERNERIRATNLYYDALKARALRTARAGGQDSAQRQLDAAQKRYDAGDAPRLDITRAQVAVARAQSDLAGAKADDGSATDALARELDRPMSALEAIVPVWTPLSRDLPAPEAAVALALAQRADVRSAQFNVDAAAGGVAAARAGVLPAVTLAAGYARGVDSGFRTSGPTLSALVSLPVGGSVTARVHAQTALLDAARARQAGVGRTIALEVGAAARAAAATVEVEQSALTERTAAQAEFDAASLGYDRGASTSLDLSTARAGYVQAVVDALSAQYDRLRAQAVLTLEIGA